MMIPRELTEYKQWVLWRRAEVDGRKTKIPLSPWSGKAAACDKPQTWSTFHHVCHVRRRFRADGIGFVFTAADPFCGIDLDRCRTATGEVTAQASDVIRKMNSYAELSPSGTGVHILLKAKMAATGRRSGLVEVYSAGRYFTMTGQHIAGTPVAIEDRQEELDSLTAELFPPSSQVPRECLSSIGDLTDEELIERAKCARNGDRFRRLWAGDTSEYGNDRSRADAALCCLLAFWTGGDAARVERLFRRSGLMRDKWNRRTGETTYGQSTVEAALRLLIPNPTK